MSNCWIMFDNTHQKIIQRGISIVRGWIIFSLFGIGCPQVYASSHNMTSLAQLPDVILESVQHIYPNGHISHDEFLGVINLDYSEKEHSVWLLLQRYGKHHILGYGFTFHPVVQQVKASPHGKFLAVIATGEGHPILEVIDLPQLLNDKRYQVLYTLASPPFAGLSIESWHEESLHVATNELLTHRPTSLTLPNGGIFAINIQTGNIEAVSDEAKNPIPAYMDMLISPRFSTGEKEIALLGFRELHAVIALPLLHQQLKTETDDLLKTEIQKTIDALSQNIEGKEKPVKDDSKDMNTEE